MSWIEIGVALSLPAWLVAETILGALQVGRSMSRRNGHGKGMP